MNMDICRKCPKWTETIGDCNDSIFLAVGCYRTKVIPKVLFTCVSEVRGVMKANPGMCLPKSDSHLSILNEKILAIPEVERAYATIVDEFSNAVVGKECERYAEQFITECNDGD